MQKRSKGRKRSQRDVRAAQLMRETSPRRKPKRQPPKPKPKPKPEAAG